MQDATRDLYCNHSCFCWAKQGLVISQKLLQINASRIAKTHSATVEFTEVNPCCSSIEVIQLSLQTEKKQHMTNKEKKTKPKTI